MHKNFNAFTNKANGIANVLFSEVIICPNKNIHPDSQEKKCLVIWDTGATNCAISSTLTKDCNLVSTGKAQTNTANGLRDCDTFIIDLLLPNNVKIPNVQVTECELDPAVGMLIGMDIISLSDFSVTNVDGQTSFSFRIPSCERIDYVTEANKIKEKIIYEEERKLSAQIKIHGNEKCSCGSGRKYRYCCGKKKQEELDTNKSLVG